MTDANKTKELQSLSQNEQTATYIDNDGNRQTGYYSAAAGNAGLGSTALTTGDGTHWDQMRGMYQQMYDEQVRANNDALETAAARAREATQEALDSLNAGYQGTNRQLYRDYMQHRRTLPQEMAAQGYSGGLSESAMLRLRNSYEEGLNENERARIGQENSAKGQLAQQLYEAQAKAAAANQQANQQRLSYLTALQEQQYQDMQQRAATLASAGDFSGYKNLGYSDTQIEYLADIWARQNPVLAYSLGKIDADTYYKLTGSYPPGYETGGGGGGGGYVPPKEESLQEQVNKAAAAGYSPLAITKDLNNNLPDGNYSVDIPLVGGGGTVRYTKSGSGVGHLT